MATHETAQAFSKIVFDYLVIGGGNTGLPVAARLSEDPQVTVGVIEAGLLLNGDPLVEVPGYYAQAVGNPKYDWSFSTVAQPHAGGLSIPINRGKMLGGSSGINFLTWDRASKQEYDAWKIFSDADGWDWEALFPYFCKSEQVAPEFQDPYPSMSQSNEHVVTPGIPHPHGSSGPVKVSYNPLYSEIVPHFIKGWNALGIPTNANPYGGKKTGVFNSMNAIDREKGVRCDAAKAYLPAASTRKNLVLLTGARATRILFKDGVNSEGKFVATAVSFDVDGTIFSVSASKEIIISAGAIQSPQLLELSGIGNQQILNSMGIKPLVHLPGVGENFQEHICSSIQYLAKPGVRTLDQLRIDAAFKEEQASLYESSKKGWLAVGESTFSFYPLNSVVDKNEFHARLEALETSLKGQNLTDMQKAQYEIQLRWMKESDVPDMEMLLWSKGVADLEADKSYFVLLASVQHPFSRGSIHINSKDPLASPVIDPCFLSNEFDLDMLVDGYRFLERFADTEPMREVIQSVSFPRTPFLGSKELSDHIRTMISSMYHSIGTSAMARREIGGVVDSHLKVYGTANLRIADISIIPLSISAHTQATAYAIGEKAADLIKQDM